MKQRNVQFLYLIFYHIFSTRIKVLDFRKAANFSNVHYFYSNTAGMFVVIFYMCC